MPTKQISYDYPSAVRIALEAVGWLRMVCNRATVAGSVRRMCPTVHDIDLVIWPKYEALTQGGLFGDSTTTYTPTELYDLLSEERFDLRCSPKPDSKIIPLRWKGMPIELYLCEPDGANFEALLQMRTGSREFNIGLAKRAKALGAEYRAGYGIYANGKRIDDGTESGIFASLGMKWIDPERRR